VRTPRSLTRRRTVAVIMAMAMLIFYSIWVTSSAEAKTAPRPAPLGPIIPHLMTFGPHHKLIPVREGMRIGRLTVPRTGQIQLTSEICDPYYTSNGGICLAVDMDNVQLIIAGWIAAAAGVFAAIWVVVTRPKQPEDDTEEEDSGEVGGSEDDEGLCLTQAGGVPEFGTCNGTGAVETSATWILTGVQQDYGLENEYYYDKGDDYYLTTPNYDDGVQVELHALFGGSGGQQLQTWYFPGVLPCPDC
jgi:hypothetical protein